MLDNYRCDHGSICYPCNKPTIFLKHTVSTFRLTVHCAGSWRQRSFTRSLRQQLSATVISMASQIQMENRSQSAVLLIMYGTDRAARLWTTGGPSHVPVKPFGYVLRITHVSW